MKLRLEGCRWRDEEKVEGREKRRVVIKVISH